MTELSFIKNSQGRYDVKGIYDCGFERNNKPLTGIVLYEGCIGKIIGFILSIFGKAILQEVTNASNPQKKSYVYVNKESFLLMAERNLELIAGRPIEFTSKTIQNLVDHIMSTAWQTPSFRVLDGNISKFDKKLDNVKKFFKEFNENTFFAQENIESMRTALKDIYPYTKNGSSHHHIDFYLFSERDIGTKNEKNSFLRQKIENTLAWGCDFFKFTLGSAHQTNILGFSDKFFDQYEQDDEVEKKFKIKAVYNKLIDAFDEVSKPNYANRTPGVKFLENRSLFQDSEWNEIHQVLTDYGNIQENALRCVVKENHTPGKPNQMAQEYGFYLDKDHNFYERDNLLPEGMNNDEKKKVLLHALEGIKESFKNFK